MIGENQQKVYDILNALEIKYTKYEHKPIYTVKEAMELNILIPGVKCKNLFLRNGRGDIYYLVIVDQDKNINLKLLAQQIHSTRLSFASEEKLFEYLKLTPGSVSPFGIVNDINKEVIILIDTNLKNADLINFHPNNNVATIGISYIDLEKFINWNKNKLFHI